MKKYLSNKSMFPKTFWIICAVKLICGSFFASHYVTKGFLPFLNYFITSGQNPYDYFFMHSNIVFPYPAGMLMVMSVFLTTGHFFLNSLFPNPYLTILLFKLPILMADIAIYVMLCKLLPSKEKKVLWLYFASPILFYINYYHGQLDVIPTAFLIISLYFLYLKKYLHSFILLGIGIAMKTHLIIALPFYIIYAVRQRKKFSEIIFFSTISLVTFLIINIPFLTKSYLLTVFNNTEQQRLFLTLFPFQHKDLSLLIAPAALLICFYIFAAKRKLNFDSLILMLGLIFTILIALVPPMQGWFYWSIPLFTYFLIKYDSHKLTYLMMNIFFITFFIFTKDSDIFESAAFTFSSLSRLPNPYQLLEIYGFNAILIQNILFTCLQISVAMNAFWTYRLGIHYNNLYIDKQKAFVLGIGGDSGVGKSTLCEGIINLVGSNQSVILNGDDSHKWERNDDKWQIFTHLDPKANNIHKDVDQLYALVDGKTVDRINYDHKTGKFSKPTNIEENQFIIFQGLHPFFLEKMRGIYDFKIFIEAEEDLRKKWKIKRDINERGHSLLKVKKDINKRKKDSVKFILPQKKFADWIVSYYSIKNIICFKHVFNNSIPLDSLVNELTNVSGLKIKHKYTNTTIQTLTIEGKIKEEMISNIAYKLYPNLNELINNLPNFNKNSEGINQLLFINYLNFFFINNKPETQIKSNGI